jgi:hypothetical protein
LEFKDVWWRFNKVKHSIVLRILLLLELMSLIGSELEVVVKQNGFMMLFLQNDFSDSFWLGTYCHINRIGLGKCGRLEEIKVI